MPLSKKKKKKSTKEYKQHFLNIEHSSIKSLCSLNLLGLSHNGSYFKKEENAVNFRILCLIFENGTINRLSLLSLKKCFLT